MSTFENLEWEAGRPNPAGIKSIAYFVKKSLIKTRPKLNADGTSYEGEIELVAGVKWQTIYTTQGVGKVEAETIGEKDGQQPINKGSLSYPDIDDSAMSFMTKYCNDNMVYVVPRNTSKGVRHTLLGLELDATTKFKATSGDKPGSQKGLTIEIEDPSPLALPRYVGLIETDKGTLNCETDVFTPTAP